MKKRSTPDTATARTVRIYEYEDEEGTLYWSFAKPMTTIPMPRRLRAYTKIGTRLGHFLVALRHVAAALSGKAQVR